jgi:MYXO-CTERM domain-containing protein
VTERPPTRGRDLDPGEVVEERWATVWLAAVTAALLFWWRRRRHHR